MSLQLDHKTKKMFEELKYVKLRWSLFVTYTIIQSIISSEMCSLHLTHSSAHTPGAVGSWGIGVLLKGLTSVVDNSCRSRDSNPQPRVTSRTTISIRATIQSIRLNYIFSYVLCREHDSVFLTKNEMNTHQKGKNHEVFLNDQSIFRFRYFLY